MFSNTDWIETLSTIGFQSKTHLVQKMNDDMILRDESKWKEKKMNDTLFPLL
jgi:hypothetical protein